MSKRELFARVLEATGLNAALLWARARIPSPWLTVLTYHRVCHVRADYPFDPEVVDATPEQLDEHLAILNRHFHVISLDALRAYLEGAPLPPNPALVTFDDGYADWQGGVLPILKKHRVPGVFFVATDYVSRRRLFWWDKVSYFLGHAKRRHFALHRAAEGEIDLTRDMQGSRRWLLRLIKDRKGLDLDLLFDELASAASVPWSDARERELADTMIITWDQVRALRAAGMDVQSHTRTHRVLQTLDPERLAEELQGSRRELEEQLQERVHAIAYPVGKAIAEEPEIRQAVDRAGYVLGFNYANRASRLKRALDRLDVGRLAVEPSYSLAYLRSVLAVPLLTGR
ncbi:MAG: polysaccharide deacetylase family protein [Deltaproteobacteria bacterium]|nr:polysaccharide deacetylase family protein [Deltaproteobacteria bacterium]